MAERLDRVGLLHQRALVGDAHRTQRVGHDDHQKQAAGRQAKDNRRGLDALQQVAVLVEKVVETDQGAKEEDHNQQQTEPPG